MNNETINIIFCLIASIIICNYLIFINITIKGWRKIKYFYASDSQNIVNISILIPFRNEAKCLPQLIDSLKKQSLQPHEIIFIDDHSTDQSLDILRNADFGTTSIKILLNDENENGKKAALKKGLGLAQGEWILQTDADCVLPGKWTDTYASYISQNQHCHLIAGPVAYNRSRSIFSWFFELDFLSLVFSGAGLIGAGVPTYCNGANMAYRRETALGFDDPFNASVASGDDVFLLQQIAQKYDDAIAFLKSKAAIVSTLAPENLGDFFRQRVRWGAKTKYYKSGFAKYIAGTVLSTNLLLIIIPFAAFYNAIFLWIFVSLFLFKLLSDTSILIPVNRFFSRNNLYPWILISSLLYPFYIVITGIISLVYNNKWKERNI